MMTRRKLFRALVAGPVALALGEGGRQVRATYAVREEPTLEIAGFICDLESGKTVEIKHAFRIGNGRLFTIEETRRLLGAG
jgi:hypothetical protein